MINLSNIDYIYDKDPKQFPEAKPLSTITWEECQKLVGTEWKPGMNAPFDPIAAKLAKELNLTAIVTNGNDFDNLENIIEGRQFKGTIIQPARL
jgi:uridylate kinase